MSISRHAVSPEAQLHPAAGDGPDLARDLRDLRREMEAGIGPVDLAHLYKLERWGRWCTALGYATAWIAPNPLSAALLAHGNTTRWAIVNHHVSHRGYDRVPGVPARYTSRGFAAGDRRFLDWLDWMTPAAWGYEHNVLHHSHTGELSDPDLVEENLQWLRAAALPRPLKYGVVGFFAATWKLSYYAPNTFHLWKRSSRQRRDAAPTVTIGSTAPEPLAADLPQPASPATSAAATRDAGHRLESSFVTAFDPRTADGREFWRTCVAPYLAVRFALIPLAFAPIGSWAVTNVFLNTLLAELLANLQSFALIAPNHAGDDIYRFTERAKGRAAFYRRQILGSVNYETGGDWITFLMGGLNYQIEHHLFPDLPLLKYQQYQARIRAICAKHGLPYRQEPLRRRIGKLLDIMVGATSMRREPAGSDAHGSAPAR